MKPTANERAWAGLLMFILILLVICGLGFFFASDSFIAKLMPIFTYSFIGLLVLAVTKPRPFLDWVRKWTRGWPKLP